MSRPLAMLWFKNTGERVDHLLFVIVRKKVSYVWKHLDRIAYILFFVKIIVFAFRLFFQLTAYDFNVLTGGSFVIFLISYQELCDVCF